MQDNKIVRELITPERAAKYLRSNTSNRVVSPRIIQKYVNDMLADKWVDDTFELIKISKTGIILDGQHRLLSVVKSNKAIYFHIVRGVEDSVFSVLDTGKSRNASDCFKISGVKLSNMLPSIISHYNLLCSGKTAKLWVWATNAELLNQYYNNSEYWSAVARQTILWYNSFAKILAPSFIGGFYAHFHDINPDKADEFMSQLATGIGVTNPAILILRNKLIQDKMAVKKMPIKMKMAFVIKSWNYFVNGKEPKSLRYSDINEAFPVAIKGI